ncbi:hypothetical protein D918_03918 [Trichuris suis]|nr:hypothetical protein D918_03918 [Trichuris suis]
MKKYSQFSSRRSRQRRIHSSSDAVYQFSKQHLSFDLQPCVVSKNELIYLPFCDEFLWMIDFAFVTFIVFSCSELFHLLSPGRANQEVNLSVVWYLIMACICLKNMFRMTAVYFNFSGAKGERSLCIATGVVSFFIIMTLLLFSDQVLDVGIHEAFDNFTLTTADFYAMHDIRYPQVGSPATFYFNLSWMLALLSMLLTFPCFRLARTYKDALESNGLNALQRYHELRGKRSSVSLEFLKCRVALHFSLLGPCCCLLWCRPVAERLLESNAFFLLPHLDLGSARVLVVMIFVGFRLSTAGPCLQAYLNLAIKKIAKLRTEAGKISNKDLNAYISSVFIYFVAVANQYYAPPLFLFSVNCLLKTLGNYSWLPLNSQPTAVTPPMSGAKDDLWRMTSFSTIFNVTVNRGLWNVIVSTTCSIQFALSVVAIVYSSYFQTSAVGS